MYRRMGFFGVAYCLLTPVLFIFNVKINKTTKAILKDSESSLFVDHFALVFKMQIIAQCHQTASAVCQQCEQMGSR